MSEEHQRTLRELRAMKWSAKFHGVMKNASAPGGKVDMWLLVDDQSGEGIVSLGRIR
jgi:hypothetical protein